MLNDNTYIVKPGIKASFEYLRDLFLRKQKEMCKNINHDYSNVSDKLLRQGSHFQLLN